ncbi:hypothetical protein GCM10010156_77370 [Planobispora rosea]|uniref:Uncharacterized protein n=1 Tax=Planobispora rosea TaxID=35762 RepID=A0A8J3SB09_PLARO|nr:hypothetical protein [Planobispora rosea]GGT08988.1 hypothetical protein GCM10010156_77370 [Planobispora rosea]GIH89286.1 hypothetical protein Pro02_76940 [Planobispora rosea]
MTATDYRAAVIQGLRDLATFPEANPAVPIPRHDVTFLYFPTRGTDAEMIAEIDRIATLLGVTPDPSDTIYGHHKARLAFGPVGYEALAVLAARHAQHQADTSYSGYVTPAAVDAA